jgi:hypothetical protein
LRAAAVQFILTVAAHDMMRKKIRSRTVRFATENRMYLAKQRAAVSSLRFNPKSWGAE